MGWPVRLAWLLAIPFWAAADAQQAPPPAASPDDQIAAAAPPIAMPLIEIDERMTVPVTVGEGGPFRFVIDTGAERSVVSRELAAQLGLLPGKRVSVVSMTDTRVLDTVIVPSLVTIPPLGGPGATIEAPAVEARYLGAAGLLGLDTLRDRRVSIDFEAGRMAVEPASRRAFEADTSDGEIVVRGKSRFGQLIVSDAYYGNTRIRVVLDTGSQVTIANSALRRKMARKQKTSSIVLVSVTGGQTVADYSVVSNVRIGDARFTDLPVAFADVAPFEKFGLSKKPALLLGMDALRIFRRVEIDFPNRQVRLLLPRKVQFAQK